MKLKIREPDNILTIKFNQIMPDALSPRPAAIFSDQKAFLLGLVNIPL